MANTVSNPEFSEQCCYRLARHPNGGFMLIMLAGEEPETFDKNTRFESVSQALGALDDFECTVFIPKEI